jgi:hypothetical protein
MIFFELVSACFCIYKCTWTAVLFLRRNELLLPSVTFTCSRYAHMHRDAAYLHMLDSILFVHELLFYFWDGIHELLLPSVSFTCSRYAHMHSDAAYLHMLDSILFVMVPVFVCLGQTCNTAHAEDCQEKSQLWHHGSWYHSGLLPHW